MMTISDLRAAVAEDTGLSAADAERAVAAVLDTVSQALAKGEKVSLSGFGTFEARARAARTGRNPQTGEEIQIAATVAPAFKAAAPLKRLVAGH